ncbi:MAG: DUF192 domain-containing protein [Candidatus Nanosalina sp.]
MNEQRRNVLSLITVVLLILGVALTHGSLREKMSLDQNLGQLKLDKANASRVKAVFTDGNGSLGTLLLEKADTEAERRKGLMGRKSLEQGNGMIFIWNNSRNRTFWMKNTYVPLDMIFVTAEKTIRTIKHADPQPNVSEEELKLYTSEGPVRYVIETKQNFTERNNIKEGYSVSFNLSG